MKNKNVISLTLLSVFFLIFANGCLKNDFDFSGPHALETLPVIDITKTSATCGGKINSDGGKPLTQSGICWSTTPNPTTSNNKIRNSNGTLGDFSSSLTGLRSGTTYYVKAYAINSIGTAYGKEVSFKTESLTPATASFNIGDTYQGGIIAYKLVNGDPGYVAGQTHGLIVAPVDQSVGMQWFNGIYNVSMITSTNFGAGMLNTNAIVTKLGAGSYAARLCDALVLDGYSDWYLPSRDELQKILLNHNIYGGFVEDPYTPYWSSSYATNLLNSAWVVNYNSTVNSTGYDNRFCVRAIRAF